MDMIWWIWQVVPAGCESYKADFCTDPRWLQLSQDYMPGRIQPVQALLPLWRTTTLVSSYLFEFAAQLTIISGFLESLCDYLYDHIRPRILHEPSLETLCGVCTVLQALMVQDVSAVDEDPEEELFTPSPLPETPSREVDYFSAADQSFAARQRRTGSVMGYEGSLTTLQANGAEDESVMTRRNPHRKPLRRLHIEVLLRMVLQDAQTRLAFRAQAMLRADVEFYVPKEGDLDYPAKVASELLIPPQAAGLCVLILAGQAGKIPQRQMSISLDPDDDDEPAFLSLPPTSVQESWYPTLRATLWILSCLYTYVEVRVRPLCQPKANETEGFGVRRPRPRSSHKLP